MEGSSVSGASSTSLAPGTQFGRYDLLRRIAAGGMAELFLVRARGIEGFEKIVILKRVLPQHADNDEFTRMFLDEARLAATLHHPNIAQVYDIGQIGASYFFTMECVDGEDVRAIARAVARTGRELPLGPALAIVASTAAGLHYAHEKGGADGKPLKIVHRDVSPSNVLVSMDGAVKLVDFGVAKAASRVVETRSGTLKGKVPYMSPEQCRGEPLDRRSDVFAIGILLYELTTGTRLYSGDSDMEIINRIVNHDVTPPRQLKKDYPEALSRIVLRSLARDRERRYGSAQELQADLEEFVRVERLSTSPLALSMVMRELFPGRRSITATMIEGEGDGGDTGTIELSPSAVGSVNPVPAPSTVGGRVQAPAAKAITKEAPPPAKEAAPPLPPPMPMPAQQAPRPETPAPLSRELPSYDEVDAPVLKRTRGVSSPSMKRASSVAPAAAPAATAFDDAPATDEGAPTMNEPIAAAAPSRPFTGPSATEQVVGRAIGLERLRPYAAPVAAVLVGLAIAALVIAARGSGSGPAVPAGASASPPPTEAPPTEAPPIEAPPASPAGALVPSEPPAIASPSPAASAKPSPSPAASAKPSPSPAASAKPSPSPSPAASAKPSPSRAAESPPPSRSPRPKRSPKPTTKPGWDPDSPFPPS